MEVSLMCFYAPPGGLPSFLLPKVMWYWLFAWSSHIYMQRSTIIMDDFRDFRSHKARVHGYCVNTIVNAFQCTSIVVFMIILCFLTIEWPRYSAALSDMYNSFPVWVAIIKKPLSACNKREKAIFILQGCWWWPAGRLLLSLKMWYEKLDFSRRRKAAQIV